MHEKTIDKNVLLVSFNCSIIDENLALSLYEKGFSIKYIRIDEERFAKQGMLRKLSLIQGLYSRFLNDSSRLIICSEINDFLFLSLLSFIILRKPKKLVIVFPPSPSKESRKLFGLKIPIINLLLGLLGEILLVYTTPMERVYTNGLLDNYQYIYLPISTSEPLLMRSLIHSDKPLFVAIYRDKEKEFYINIIKLLKQLEVFPRFVFLVLNEFTKCFRDPRIVCIHTDTYDTIIDNASVVILKENSPHANELLIKSIMHGRPVLSSSEIGLLRLFIDTDLVVIEDNWKPDNISLILLKILNEIDRFKKASLSKIPNRIDNSKGIEKIISFLK